ncbi:hypothetical protein [Falsiroseomonas sp.]|uniref:hypothetical protein n=1 Tax=Falsiroseomonas sp. TaxID=2870721 RepID=UPI003F6EAC5C
MQPYSPAGAAQKTTVTASGVLVPLNPWVDTGGGAICVTVRGVNDVFLQWGSSGAVTCTEANGHPCLGRSANVFAVPGNATHIFLITQSGLTSEVQVSQGRGL